MFPLAFRLLARPVAAALLFAAGAASAQTPTFTPSAIGQPVVLEGELTVRVEDFADGHARVRHFLASPQGRVELKFAGVAPHLTSGSRVRVHGVAQSGDTLQLDAGKGNIETITAGVPYTMGEQSIAVLLVNFQDETSQPTTVADAQDLVFRDVNNHYKESSFGQTWFTGQTFGWFTIPMSKATCHPDLLASLADQKAAQAGVNLGNFRRRVYMFPKNACMNLGEAELGGINSKAWINGAFTLQVVGHELGHNYGLSHARAMNCDVGVFRDKCDYFEYGDVVDLMGNGRPGQFNAWEKEQLGWLNDGVSPPITTVTKAGRYTIEPYSASTVGPKALKIPGANVFYYVEYRQPIGADAVLAGVGNLTNGVLLHLGDKPEGTSYALDMTPGTSANNFDEMADGVLEVGKRHVDPYTGLIITLASISPTGADIDVSYGPPTCIRNAPAITLSGDGAAVQPGTPVPYTVTIQNRDSTECGPIDFGVSLVVPNGWSGGFNTWVSLKAGQTAQGTFNIASSATAAPGDYGIGATTSSWSAAHTATGSATYTVAPPPCTRNAPTVSLVGGGSPIGAGTTAGYTLTVTNRDSSTCDATDFTLARSVPAGWNSTLGATHLALNPGASASTRLDVASSATAAAGTYGIGAAASSNVDALHTANDSATYVVGPVLSIADAVIVEGNAGTTQAKFLVKLASPSTAPVRFDVTTGNGTAAAGSDYTATKLVGVTIPVGGTSVSFAVPVAGDTAIEGTETFQVVLGNIVGATIGDVAAIGTIRNDDTTIAITDASVVEGHSGARAATFTVKLSAASAKPVTFNLATVNNTAAAGSDYVARSVAGLSIPAGSTSMTFTVNVAGDVAVEGNETFFVNLSGVQGAVVADAQAVGTIRNDDTVLTIADASIAEGQSGTKILTFTVKLSAASAIPVTFNLATANRTAAAGTDYVALPLSAQSIAAGATGKAFNVTIKGDTLREANETFIVGVGSVAGAIVGDAQALGTIANDD